jgi:hypothetical protein
VGEELGGDERGGGGGGSSTDSNLQALRVCCNTTLLVCRLAACQTALEHSAVLACAEPWSIGAVCDTLPPRNRKVHASTRRRRPGPATAYARHSRAQR